MKRLRGLLLAGSGLSAFRLGWHLFHYHRTQEYFTEKQGEALVMGAKAP
jgi:hypothetical protein